MEKTQGLFRISKSLTHMAQASQVLWLLCSKTAALEDLFTLLLLQMLDKGSAKACARIYYIKRSSWSEPFAYYGFGEALSIHLSPNQYSKWTHIWGIVHGPLSVIKMPIAPGVCEETFGMGFHIKNTLKLIQPS